MEKDTIFFDKDGLTSTSANYIANIAKEAYSAVEASLNKATFYTTTISILGSTSSNTLKEGVGDSFLETVEKNLLYIAKLKSLIAWLREAVKAKERLISEAEHLDDTTIANALDITIPEAPKAYSRITEDAVIASWNIKQRNRYYYLDTVCSTIGKYIHPANAFSNAREDLNEILSERNIAKGNGRDTIIYTRTPTVDISKVEETFFALQNTYREFQAELNSMKHQIEVAIQEDDREKSAKEIEETKLYENNLKTINAEISAYRKDTVKAMQSLKITIPDSLKDTYETISKMGK